LITLAMPVISAVSAAVFLDQRVSALQAVGIAVVLASLAVVILGESRGPFPVDGPPGAGPAT
jgi:drug/metabolite transporter (DMT)-like permease